MGLPIVTTFNSGSVVRDGVEGCICAKEDVEGMAGAIERLASDKGLRLEMGVNARQRAMAFSIDAHAREIQKVVRRVCGTALAEAGAR